MNYFKLAWRNLWRSKRRTLITTTAIILAVLLSTFMTSMQEGVYGKMIDNVVKFYSGYLQVQDTSYWDTKSINNTYVYNDEMDSILNSVPEITQIIPRLESFSLMSFKEQTRGAALIGVNPQKENQMTGLSKWVKNGSYLSEKPEGILLAKNIAKNLAVEIGDTITLISQGYHGSSAAGLFELIGILEFPSPRMNNFGAYISLDRAQKFFSAPDMLTSLVIMSDNYKNVSSIKSEVSAVLPEKYEIMTWDEMQPEIVQMIEGDRAGGVIMKAVLYLVIGFGLFGTVVMMMAERNRESGIMIAVGMKKIRLQIVLFIETVLIGALGVIVGFLLSGPLIYYFHINPIPLPESAAEVYAQFGMEPFMYFSMMGKVFYNQVIIVFLITLLISLYPILKIANLNIVNALRGK